MSIDLETCVSKKTQQKSALFPGYTIFGEMTFGDPTFGEMTFGERLLLFQTFGDLDFW